MVKNAKTTKSAAVKSTGAVLKPDQTTNKMADNLATEKSYEQKEMEILVKMVENQHQNTVRKVAKGTTNAYKKKKRTKTAKWTAMNNRN